MCVRLFYRSTNFPPQLAEKESDVGVNAGMFLFESWKEPVGRRRPLIQLQKGMVGGGVIRPSNQ